MKKFFLVLSLVVFAGCAIPFLEKAEKRMDTCVIKNFNDVINLFPKNAEEIKGRVQVLKITVKAAVKKIIDVPAENRTFANTVQALDNIGVLSSKTMGPIGLLREVSPEESIRDAAYAAIIEWQPFAQEEVSKNVKLFEAFKSYVEGNARNEKLNQEERYYLDETMKGYRREGLFLPADELAKVKKLKTALTELTLKFSKNIADVDIKIPFSREELDGLPEQVLASLKKDADGKFLVEMDYPIVFPLFKFVTNAETRKKVNRAFQNRAYPENFAILKDIMKVRAQLAQLLGFDSFTDYDLDDTMAGSSDAVRQFSTGIMEKAKIKQRTEFEELTQDLPPSVELTEDGKIYPWDMAFLKEFYRKKHFDIDDKKLTEYFPVEHVVPAVLSIYEEFLGLTFKEFSCAGLWYSGLKCIQVYEGSVLRGYLILDLYPRPNKFSHACMVDVISPQRIGNDICPALITILANFPEASAEFPGLLNFGDVRTFFHEFGHAMHAILGATEMNGFAGTNVKVDFVETPSQMFEEWLNDRDILKKLSHHYKTGDSLPDDMIEKLVELDKFAAGDLYLRQIALGLYSLRLFEDSSSDIQQLYKQIIQEICPHVWFDDQAHMVASFGHLTDSLYASKYYSYLWAKIFSLDLVSVIKQYGLLNPGIGHKVSQEILSKGGSVDPSILLRNFLGREPSQDAFLKHFGFNA